MLDKSDLQAIAELIDSKLAAQDERTRQYIDMLMENEIRPSFKILAEGHETILQQTTPRLDDAEQRIDHLETDVMLLKSAI